MQNANATPDPQRAKAAQIERASKAVQRLCRQQGAALQAVHCLIQGGGATEGAWRALYDRVIEDGDAAAAYYLAIFAQKIDDLPFDGADLVALALKKGDAPLQQKLLRSLPKDARARLSSQADFDFSTKKRL